MKNNDLNHSRRLGRIDLNREAEKVNIKTYWCRIAYGAFEKWNQKEHRHSFWELHLCLDGESIIDVEGEIIKLVPKHFLLLPPHKKHTIQNESKDFSKLVWGFSVKDDGVNSALTDGCSKMSAEKADDEILTAVSVILENAEGKDFEFYNIVKDRLYFVFVTLVRKFTALKANENFKKTYRIEMNSVRTFISNNISSEMTASEIASQFYISKSRLEVMCMEEYGITVNQLRRELRLEYIRDMLRDTEYSLDEIAQCAGFSDRYSLGKFFKKHEGMPPAKYRKSAKK